MSLRVTLAALAAALAAGISATPVAAQAPAPAPIDAIAVPTPIAAYGGLLVWSAPDGHGRYALMERDAAGTIRTLPVASRGVPFDVDLGPTTGGTIYAVYSRCRTEPVWSGDQMPPYEQGKGCDVYKLDLTTLAEQRYTKVNASDGSEYWPSYWKGVVAFARAYESDPSKPYIYTKTIASSAPSARQPGGSRGSGRSTPLQLELYGTHLAFGWRYQGHEEAPAYDLRIDTIGGDHTRLDETPGGGLSSTVLGWPSFENGRVYWLRSCVGDPGGCETTRRFMMSNYTGTPQPLVATSPPYVQAMERAGGITWAETDINSIYGCMTDPATTPSCAIEPLRPEYTPQN
jgi:hypothetical protein